MRPRLADQGRNEQKDERDDGDRRLSPRPCLTIVVELEGDSRVFVESDTEEDAERLLVALRGGGAIEELHELADDLAAYVEETTA